MTARTAPAADAPASRFRRFLAATGAALVLLLAIASVSPSLHAWLHGHAEPDASDDCAVVLFASGVALATALVVVAPRTLARDLAARTAEEIFLASPRYLLQPERGPPLS